MSLRRLLEDCSHAFSARPPWLLRASGIMAFRSSPAFVAILFGVSGFCEAHRSVANGTTALPALRIVDANGAYSHVGLVQVRTSSDGGAGFGTVCGMNLAAADVICAQLGFDFGSVSTSPCGSYGGVDSCGESGMPVGLANLVCDGGELDIQDCSFTAPDAACLDHSLDSIVYCGLEGHSSNPPEGTSRILSFDGSPSIDGVGRLEMFSAGGWSPVCTSGFTSGAANVACKSMGFAGSLTSAGNPSCGNVGGNNYCGAFEPRVSSMACSGEESDLSSCEYESSDDVFCAPEESVVLRCAGGGGDSQGRARKVASPIS